MDDEGAINSDFIDCDPKKWVQSMHIGGGKYLCPHYNLKIK